MGRLEGKPPDGKAGVNEQFVDDEGRAGTRAIAQTDMAHAIAEGCAYTLHSTYSATGGEEVISLKNDDVAIHVERIVVSSTVASVVSVMRVTSGTPAGTDISTKAFNLKLGSAAAPGITAFGNASVTGTVDGTIIDQQLLDATTPVDFPMDGLTIPLGEAIFVRLATTGVVQVTIYFHRET